MTVRVADYIAQYLRGQGVDSVFLLSGGMIMHLLDAIGRTDGLRYYCNQHEQAAAMAAEGYARLKRALGVCYATNGPGATNILTGLAGAWQDSSPVLFVVGQCKLAHTIHANRSQGLRQFGMCEVDMVPIVRSVTKYAAVLDDPARVRYHVERAVYTACEGRPGPVLLEVPLDIQGALMDPASQEGFSPSLDPNPVLDTDVDEVLRRLSNATRPVILAGNGVGCANASAQLLRLVRSLDIPVLTTQIAKDILPYDLPLFGGHPGMKGTRSGNLIISNADLILCLGCSLHVLTTGFEFEEFAPHACKIMVDPDPAILARERVGVNMKIQADIVPFMQAIEARGAGDHNWDAWRAQCRDLKERFAVRNEPHRIDDGPVNAYDFVDLLGEVLGSEDVVVTDTGTPFFVLGQALRISGNQRYIVSGALGSMGYALPAALGVCAAAPSRNVVCVTGDGSLQVNVQELQTLRHYGMNLKLFVFLNDGYLSIRNTQDAFFNGFYVGSSRDSGVSVPPLRKLAGAYDLPYVECTCRTELRSTVMQTLGAEGPAVCGIVTQPDQRIMPTVSSALMPDGKMKSKPLHDMFPFLDEAELRSIMHYEITG